MEVWGIHHQGIYNILTVIKYSGLRSNDQLIQVLLDGNAGPLLLGSLLGRLHLRRSFGRLCCIFRILCSQFCSECSQLASIDSFFFDCANFSAYFLLDGRLVLLTSSSN